MSATHWPRSYSPIGRGWCANFTLLRFTCRPQNAITSNRFSLHQRFAAYFAVDIACITPDIQRSTTPREKKITHIHYIPNHMWRKNYQTNQHQQWSSRNMWFSLCANMKWKGTKYSMGKKRSRRQRQRPNPTTRLYSFRNKFFLLLLLLLSLMFWNSAVYDIFARADYNVQDWILWFSSDFTYRPNSDVMVRADIFVAATLPPLPWAFASFFLLAWALSRSITLNLQFTNYTKQKKKIH